MFFLRDHPGITKESVFTDNPTPQRVVAIQHDNLVGFIDDVENFSCPKCGAHDRERHLYLYFDKLGLWQQVEGKKVQLTQSTNYPWNGDVSIDILPKRKQDFTLNSLFWQIISLFVKHKVLLFLLKLNQENQYAFPLL